MIQGCVTCIVWSCQNGSSIYLGHYALVIKVWPFLYCGYRLPSHLGTGVRPIKPEVSTCDRPPFAGKRPHIYTAGMRLYEAEMRPSDIHIHTPYVYVRCSLLDHWSAGPYRAGRAEISEIIYHISYIIHEKVAVDIHTFLPDIFYVFCS